MDVVVRMVNDLGCFLLRGWCFLREGGCFLLQEGECFIFREGVVFFFEKRVFSSRGLCFLRDGVVFSFDRGLFSSRHSISRINQTRGEMGLWIMFVSLQSL